MKYEDIEKVNKEIRTIDVKGKEYAEVNQRIKAFRMLYPDGIIDTKLESNEDGVCVFRAQVGFYQADGCVQWLASGYAYEKENSSFINKTSYIENCETSAVGRALGMLGLGIDTSIASAEEVQNAIKNQEKKSSTYREQLIAYCKENNLDMNEIAKDYNLTNKSDEDDYKNALSSLKEG